MPGSTFSSFSHMGNFNDLRLVGKLQFVPKELSTTKNFDFLENQLLFYPRLSHFFLRSIILGKGLLELLDFLPVSWLIFCRSPRFRGPSPDGTYPERRNPPLFLD